MKHIESQKTRAARKLTAFLVLVGAIAFATPTKALACSGGGGFYECKSYWLDALYYPCLELECSGLQGEEFRTCRNACWADYISTSQSDCSDCPI